MHVSDQCLDGATYSDLTHLYPWPWVVATTCPPATSSDPLPLSDGCTYVAEKILAGINFRQNHYNIIYLINVEVII